MNDKKITKPKARMPLIIGDNFISVPLGDAPQKAAEAWMNSSLAGLQAVLDPFGISANDIRMPWLERIVYADEAEKAVLANFNAESTDDR